MKPPLAPVIPLRRPPGPQRRAWTSQLPPPSLEQDQRMIHYLASALLDRLTRASIRHGVPSGELLDRDKVVALVKLAGELGNKR
jgi:hypothetical protein